ncbi:MAG: hypothetical protein NTW56_00880 [Alphaproteobacteria bacterium]|nr:hypothetical protein [Alphaproteobacteria bacterium]
MMEPDHPDVVAARQLITDVLTLYQREWETTRNPLWVWQALDFILPMVPPAPLPPWCADYLRVVAQRMKGLKAGLDWRRQPIPLIVSRKNRRTLSDQEAMALLPAALGLTARGYNAFGAHSAHQRRMNNEARLWQLLTTHPTKAAAVRAYMRETGHTDPKRIMIAARKVAGFMAGRGKPPP